MVNNSQLIYLTHAPLPLHLKPLYLWTTQSFFNLLKQCCSARSLGPGKQAHCRLITTGVSRTVHLSNVLLHLYVVCSDLQDAVKVFDEMPARDVVSANTLLFGFAVSGRLPAAEALFYSMPDRDIVSWNSLSSSYLLDGDAPGAASLFAAARSSGIPVDGCALALALKASSLLRSARLGAQLHGAALRLGLTSDPVAASALVDTYGKCGLPDDSLRFFAGVPVRNRVMWSAALGGRMGAGDFVGGAEMLKDMLRSGGRTTQSIYATVLSACGWAPSLGFGRQIHGHSLRAGLGFTDVVVKTATLDMYAKCEAVGAAREVFDEMPSRNRRSYNAMIVGHGEGGEAIELFRELMRSGLGCDEVSISGSLSCCPGGGGAAEGGQIHGLALKKGVWGKVAVGNAGVDMYGRCGAHAEARLVFDEMEAKDVISWNALMAALERNEGGDETLAVFAEMVKCRVDPDEFTHGTVLKACSALSRVRFGSGVHGRAIRSGLASRVFVYVGLVDMYSKCGYIEDSLKVHWGAEHPVETASWNAIISGYSSQQRSEEAQAFFSVMLEKKVNPDRFTFAAVLDACAELASGRLGEQVHSQVVRRRLHGDAYISSTLVDMYSKCGNLGDAQRVFERARGRDLVTWNAMISSLAQHGMAEEALGTYRRMVSERAPPNGSTFVAVLRACGHMGMVEEALRHFRSMEAEHGVRPGVEHRSCMVDVVGRAGRVGEALRMVEDMAGDADLVTWRTLLSACNLHGEVRAGETAVRGMVRAHPGAAAEDETSAYVLLCNVYATAGMWEEVGRVRERMRERRVKKEPGCSWIEASDGVHAFLAGGGAHPKGPEIYHMLGSVMAEMSRAGCCLEYERLLEPGEDGGQGFLLYGF